ncbi:hypothetical protein [Ralstonia solanacearum]|uniref:hypothetical protein n=1 Tax=Ralstonia solanacearum TaxID=305 RepID=UPI0005ABEFE6|nr:hypothetical protein [Ralstonia solanacearum]MDC6177140.1 hypothetical protein [Ralstonia solanacearum]MDC6238328.1 hypothetical protein [Ralstonia solanacearum]
MPSTCSSQQQALQHTAYSTQRERIIEHVFVGELLRRLWVLGIADVELLRSEVDAGGYDLVLCHKAIVRHVQLKSVVEGGRSASVTVNLKLAEKPSGCVVWLAVGPDLNLREFRWFGGRPGEPLPDVTAHQTARHARANAMGVKQARPGHRVLRSRDFQVLKSLDELIERLFGEIHAHPSASPVQSR